MAFLDRPVIRRAFCSRFVACLACALWLLAALAPETRAQPSTKPSPTFRILAMGWDVAGLYYDSRDAAPPVPVAAGTAGWSAPYPVPAGGRVVFYRLQAPAPGETRPRRINLAETRLSEGGPSLVFLLPESEAGDVFAVHAVEDSWELHPAETVRLFSFSKRTIAVKIGSAMAELAPAQSKVLPYAPGRQFWMQAATREAEGWVMRVSSPQVAPPTVRITAVLFDQRPSADRTDTHELQFFKFIETPPAVP